MVLMPFSQVVRAAESDLILALRAKNKDLEPFKESKGEQFAGPSDSPTDLTNLTS